MGDAFSVPFILSCAHWLQITVTCVRQGIVGRDGKKVKEGGREGEGLGRNS